MPWIESHSVLIRHRKLKDFARALGVKPVTALGHIHCLWHTAIEQAEDGDLSQWSEGSIAEAAQWEGIPNDFLKAAFSSGFIEKSMVIHDWIDYTGKYLISKYKTSNRQRLVDIWAKFGKIYGKEFLNTSQTLPLDRPPTNLPTLTNQPTNPPGRKVEKEFLEGVKQVFGLNPTSHREELRLYENAIEFMVKDADLVKVRKIADRYKETFPKMAFTPRAVLNNWDLLASPVTAASNGLRKLS